MSVENHSVQAAPDSTSDASAQVARRGFVLASLGFLAACASESTSRVVARGGESSRLLPGLQSADGSLPPQRWAPPVTPMSPVPPPAAGPKNAAVHAGDKSMLAATDAWMLDPYRGRVIPRSKWTLERPNAQNMECLGTVRKITVHHTALKFGDTDVDAVKRELNHVRFGEMHPKQGTPHEDIAYHFIIDRAGRVWEGRDLIWQGSHVRNCKGVNNRTGNVGVVLLGNFMMQQPSAAQLATTKRFVMELQKTYRVPKQVMKGGMRSKDKGVFTHQELSPTECPGDNMQSAWAAMIYPRLITKF